MLRSIIESWTGHGSSSPAAAAAAAAPQKSIPEVTKQPNEDRLKDIHYQHDYPLLFEDPITNTIMDIPVILNNCAAQTIDKSTLIQCKLAGDSTCFVNPFNRKEDVNGIIQYHPMTGTETKEEKEKKEKKINDLKENKRAFYTEHTSLKEQIDEFVQHLECLNHLIKQLDQLLCPIDDIVSLFKDSTLASQVIEQQKVERISAIWGNKSEMIAVLKKYIRITEVAIDRHDDTPDIKKKYKEALLTGPRYLQNLLAAELEHLLKLPPKEQYEFAIEKIDYYRNLIFTPLTTDLQNAVIKRTALLSSLSDTPPVDVISVATSAATPATTSSASAPANPAQASSPSVFSLTLSTSYRFFNLASTYSPLMATEENRAASQQHNDNSSDNIRRSPSPSFRGVDVD